MKMNGMMKLRLESEEEEKKGGEHFGGKYACNSCLCRVLDACGWMTQFPYSLPPTLQTHHQKKESTSLPSN